MNLAEQIDALLVEGDYLARECEGSPGEAIVAMLRQHSMNPPTSEAHALLIGFIAGAAHQYAEVRLIDDDNGIHQDTFQVTFGGWEYFVSVVPK